MKQKINWYVAPFFVLMPFVGILGTIWTVWAHGFHPATLALTIFYIIATGLSITAGYHRLFSHATYKAAWPVRLFFVLFGAAAFEGSVWEWSTDHRDHHRYTDQDKDPYNIKKGLWFAHMGWILQLDTAKRTFKNIDDLKSDKMLAWQHRNFLWLAITTCYVVPAALAASWGDLWGGLFMAGALRVSLNHHFTFFINSFCHYFGKKTYSDLTARDNWILSLFTYGEGFHNFHHQFASDYRNGIRWFHYDPSKWLIWTLSKLGLAWDLKSVDAEMIAKSVMQMEEKRLLAEQKVCPSRIEEFAKPIREKLQELHLKILSLRKKYAMERLEEYKQEMLVCQREFKLALRAWARAKKNLLVPTSH